MSLFLEELIEAENKGKIFFNRKYAREFMPFIGTFAEAYKNYLLSINQKDLLGVYVWAPRLIRGFIDWALKKRKNPKDLKNEIYKLSISPFFGNFNLNRINIPISLLRYMFEETQDNISWAASSPKLVRKLSSRIKLSGFNPDLVFVDGHDGYRPGFLLAGEMNLEVYPIRCSRDSGRDIEPKFLEGEKDFLKDFLRNKKILICSEDISTGRTVLKIKQALEKISSPMEIRTASPIWLGYDPLAVLLPDFYAEKRNVFN